MRKLLAVALFMTACTDVPINGPTYDSVRDRLTEVPTSFYVHDESSTGTITARERAGDGWRSADAQLVIQRGYVRAAIDETGDFAVQRLELDLAPIQLGLFERPAELRDVHVRLNKPVHAPVNWTSDDNGTTTLSMPFEFDWSIKFQGDDEPFPLATQQLATTTVNVALSGSGDHVGAAIDISGSGELWNWADLLQMTDITVALDAQTAD